jgi:hypothetical protein
MFAQVLKIDCQLEAYPPLTVIPRPPRDLVFLSSYFNFTPFTPSCVIFTGMMRPSASNLRLSIQV